MNEHWVEHGGVRNYVWERFEGSPEGKPVVVLSHGSAAPGRETFDLQVPGQSDYSLMAFLAQRGFDVFAPDLRGFGRSTLPDEFLTTEQAAEDLAAVVDYVCKLRGVQQVHLLGWSWSTQVGGLFLMAHPEKVARYVSYAQMHANSPDIISRSVRLSVFQRSPYVRITNQGWKLRFDSMTPPEFNDPVAVDAFAAACEAVQSRTPTGPQIDVITRLPMVDGARIPVPTMVIHGECDDVADEAGLKPFFDALPNPDKRYVVVPEGGHMLHLQKGRVGLYQAVADWFTA